PPSLESIRRASRFKVQRIRGSSRLRRCSPEVSEAKWGWIAGWSDTVAISLRAWTFLSPSRSWTEARGADQPRPSVGRWHEGGRVPLMVRDAAIVAWLPRQFCSAGAAGGAARWQAGRFPCAFALQAIALVADHALHGAKRRLHGTLDDARNVDVNRRG